MKGKTKRVSNLRSVKPSLLALLFAWRGSLMVRQRTVNPWGLSGLCGFESRPLLDKEAPVEAVTSTGALLRTTEVIRCRNRIIRLSLCGLNRRFRTWSVITAKSKLRSMGKIAKVISASAVKLALRLSVTVQSARSVICISHLKRLLMSSSF